MKIRFDNFNKGELNIPLIYFLVFTSSAIIGFVFVKLGIIPPMKCQFKEFTGYPCPTCGTTRLVLAVYNFHFFSAFKYNPFIFVSGVMVFLWSLTGLFPLFFKKKLVFIFSKKEKRVILILLILFLILNWAYLILMGI